MTCPWSQIAEKFATGDRQSAVQQARQLLKNAVDSDWRWLIDGLREEETKWFVTAVFQRYPVPKRLLNPFLDAAIRETNASKNRQFVQPCVDSFGHRRVNEYLLDVVEGNCDVSIAGAVAALYWANMQIVFSGNVPAYTLEHATPESRKAYQALNDVWERKRCCYLRIFVSNQDLNVRRQIIPSLKLDENAYPDELKPLVNQAIAIARSHHDEYIRHRIEVQLGNDQLLRPIPERLNEPRINPDD
ncbi:hypothetical protein Poly24_27560 [Rosistilla carotiformis]|uniref:Uncharacterized protein n=2 Tax=Rosistilla carotiformis TaxID=2528017 RepID=A0A518JU21_9BACT|nr:hypothetical protein Poly24_27560 [Rosistilla carotiformis]